MTDPALFGILILERDPLTFANLPGLIQVWLQDAGGFAAVGLVVYLLYALRAPKDQPASAKARVPLTMFMLFMGVVSLLCYAGYIAAWSIGYGRDTVNVVPLVEPGATVPYFPPQFAVKFQPMLLMFGGLFALLGIGQPFATDLFKLRFRRIWALTKVGFLETWRNRMFWVFVLFVLPFLFPAQWFIPIKAEDQLRTTIDWSSLSMTLLLLLPGTIIASLSIPDDVKRQTIYTIVSKPIERFELVLGRFFGFTLLVTVPLIFMTLGTWLFISTTTLDEKAVEETQKARIPHRGQLYFRARSNEYKGTNVGREFDYRKYIAGSKSTSERAIWAFENIPAAMAGTDRDAVPCEYTFDIFRLTKGDENRGVDINIRFTTWQCDQVPPSVRGDGTWRWADAENEQKYKAEREDIDKRLAKGEIPGVSIKSLDYALPNTPGWKFVNDLAEKYGFYEVASVEVYDYHPSGIPVPAGLFRKAREGSPPADKDGYLKPRVQTYVKCISDGQMLGMASGDLYYMEGEKSFTENFFKCSFGLWCQVTVAIGVAITLSTYLAGIISFLATLFIYLSAYLIDHLKDVAGGTSTGGGPFESLTRILGTDTPTAQLDRTAGVKTAEVGDVAFSWVFRRYVNIVPDVYAFSWTSFLKEGYNINFEYLAMNFILVVGYLLPWGILSYYLIRNREVAA